MNWNVEGHAESGDGLSVPDRAMQWFVLLQSGHATPADRLGFQQWIGADASHRREFEECSSLWGELASARPLLQQELDRVALDWERAAAHPLSYRGAVTWGLTRVSVNLVVLVVMVLVAGWWVTTGSETTEYRTAKGEWRTVILSDGSMITMNTETIVTVALSFAERTVVLQEGEALFAVSHANKRPFEVIAGNRVVRDVGTQFVVRCQAQNVMVTVVEGAIEVQQFEDTASTQSWQLLREGEQVSYGRLGILSPVKTVSLAAAKAWVEGKVMFEDRPLSEVIQEVGRYQAGEILILDPGIGALNVSGVFNVNDRKGFLKALEHAIPVTVSHVNGNLAVLEGKRSPLEQR
ncbi:MAG: FecR domain-containing protein [Nitrospiraceae bacterium]